MSDIVPIVKIQSSHPESQGAFVEINQSDYDPATHVLVDHEGKPIEAVQTGEGDGAADLAVMTVAQLRDLAAERNVDLGDVTKKADIIAAIEAAQTGEGE